MAFNPDGANFIGSNSDDSDANPLLKYLQHQPPEVLAQVAKSATSDIKQIISHNVQGLVGMLPSEAFNVKITTDRENLAGLLASAMMTGYFLRQMEQRMEMEDVLARTVSLAQREPSRSKNPAGLDRSESDQAELDRSSYDCTDSQPSDSNRADHE